MKHIYSFLLSLFTLITFSCGEETINVNEMYPHTQESYTLSITKDLEQFVTPHFIYTDTRGDNVDTLLLQDILTLNDSTTTSYYHWNFSNEFNKHDFKGTFKMTFSPKKDIIIEENKIYNLGHHESIYVKTTGNTHIELDLTPWHKKYTGKEVQSYLDELTQATFQINLDVNKSGEIKVEKIEKK